MTKLVILSNSHGTGLIRALPGIKEAFPGLDIAIFAVPGSIAEQCCRIEKQTFGLPENADSKQIEMTVRINGDTKISLHDADHIWAYGADFSFFTLVHILIDHDVLGFDQQSRTRTISRQFLEHVTYKVPEDSVTDLITQYGPDERLVVTQAPFPSEELTSPGETREPEIAKFERHPAAQLAFSRHQDAIATRLSELNVAHCPQPDHTRAAPFLTKAEYNEHAQGFLFQSGFRTDLRHMNTLYCRELFDKFAAEIMGLRPANQDI